MLLYSGYAYVAMCSLCSYGLTSFALHCFQCSLECHSGVKTRTVRCVDLNNNNQTVSNSFCNSTIMPNEQMNCGTGPCAIGWRRGSWSKVCMISI